MGKGASLRETGSREPSRKGVSAASGFDTARGDLQPVYDLIINRCQHVPHWHGKGARALKLLNRLAGDLARLQEERDAYRTQAVNRGWNWNLCNAYGRDEYQRHLETEVDSTLDAMLRRKTLVESYRDSGSGPQGENSRSEVEGEAPQSGGEAASPPPPQVQP